MNYFTTFLSSQAHTLRLPDQSKNDVERYVLQHQKGSVSPERAPFRRQLDFWAFSIGTAVANSMAPLTEASSVWGRKFADTRSVQMPDGLCELLAVIALAELGADHEGIDDPSQIVELANRLAGAGCPKVLEHVSDPDLRITALDKALEFATALRAAATTTA
ncbi:MAG: hypothetical protein QNL12_14655 [Acidimicrobiia bacterium]|nr:hypothetical protein [Acidimicrobiia bacterium]